MSKQHAGPYTDEEIADLYTRYSNEKVEYLVAQAKAEAQVEEEDLLGVTSEGVPLAPDYGSLKVDELVELLEKRDLPKAGNKAELIARLEEADKSGEGGGQSA